MRDVASASYIYYTDRNVGYTNAVVDIFDKHKVTYNNRDMGGGNFAIAYINSARVKKLLDGLDLYTGKRPDEV